jgi:hypothetical protein
MQAGNQASLSVNSLTLLFSSPLVQDVKPVVTAAFSGMDPPDKSSGENPRPDVA